MRRPRGTRRRARGAWSIFCITRRATAGARTSLAARGRPRSRRPRTPRAEVRCRASRAVPAPPSQPASCPASRLQVALGSFLIGGLGCPASLPASLPRLARGGAARRAQERPVGRGTRRPPRGGGAAAAAPRPEPRAARAQGGARRRRHTSRARSRRSTVRGSCCQTSRRSTAGSRPRFGRSSRSRVAGGARRRAARRCSGPPSCEPHWRLPAGAARKAASAGRRSQHPSSPRRSLALPSPPLPPLWLSLPPPPPSLALPSPSPPPWRASGVAPCAGVPSRSPPAGRGARACNDRSGRAQVGQDAFIHTKLLTDAARRAAGVPTERGVRAPSAAPAPGRA